MNLHLPYKSSGVLAFAGYAPVRSLNVAVASALGVDASLLSAPTRGRADIAFARQLCMYLAHTLLGMTYNEVARAYARDRTTVQYACGLIEDRRDEGRFDRWLSDFEHAFMVSTEVCHDRAR